MEGDSSEPPEPPLDPPLLRLEGFIVHIKGGQVNPYKPYGLFVGKANSADPDQTPQNVSSDQLLHCLHTERYIIYIKMKKRYHPAILKRKWTGPNDKGWKFHLA